MYNLYLIYAEIESIGQWKVGLSKHPNKRINELRTANPNIVGISALYEIYERDVAYKTEALLKKFLLPFKIAGEWVNIMALSPLLFLEYCEKYEQIAKTLIQIKKNKKYIY
jgi:hypothetical protein